MKTPRDVLLARHRDAEPKLDAARRRALAALAAHPSADGPARSARPRAAAPGFLLSLSALARSLRWHLAGLSAVWLVAGWLGTLDPAAPPSAPQVNRSPSATDQLIAALRENRRQITELLSSPPSQSAPARAPATLPPARRTGQLQRRADVAAMA